MGQHIAHEVHIMPTSAYCAFFTQFLE
jgi:hypothetical protein